MPDRHQIKRTTATPTGVSRELAIQHAAMLNNSSHQSIVDVVVITTHVCDGCGLPHLIKTSSTSAIPDDTVAIMAMAITDILEVYAGDVGRAGGSTVIYGDE